MERQTSRFLKIAAAALIFLGLFQPLGAANKLSIVRITPQAIQVRLENSVPIVGLQFSLRACSELKLVSIDKVDRTNDTQWMISSYSPNDSTINVVMLNTQLIDLSTGAGGIAQVSIEIAGTAPSASYAINVENVVAANSKASRVPLEVSSLQWTNNGYLSENEVPEKQFELGQNFPNPFNPSTQIAYRLDKPAQVSLKIYDVAGREIMKLVDEYQYVGQYLSRWNSTDNTGVMVPSGVYFAKLQVGNDVATRKMILAK